MESLPGVCLRYTALVFHGAYLRKTELLHTRTEGCSDAFATASNITQSIAFPLQRAGVQVLTFFDTVATCAAADARLVQLLEPSAHAFSPCQRPRPVDSYIEVLKMVLTWRAHRIDAVVLLRFDVKYRTSLDALPIDWTKLNFAFPDGPVYWAKERKVSDLFHVLPAAFVPLLIKALDHSPASRPGAHFVYLPLAKSLGQSRLRFIDAHGRGSNLAADDPEPRSFLFIDRGCSGLSASCPSATWNNMTCDLSMTSRARPRGQRHKRQGRGAGTL